jgi:hypothetical protein
MTDNNQTSIDPVQAVRDAADYLARNGWARNTWFKGEPGCGNPAACAIGAISIVVTGAAHTVELEGRTYWSDLLDSPVADRAAIEAVAKVIATFIEPEYHSYGNPALDIVVDWNDEDGQYAGHVVATMRAAADHYIQLQATERVNRMMAEAGDG